MKDIERLQFLIEHLNIKSLRQLAFEIGCTPQAFYKPEYKMTREIALLITTRFNHVSIDWLEKGEGEMFLRVDSLKEDQTVYKIDPEKLKQKIEQLEKQLQDANEKIDLLKSLKEMQEKRIKELENKECNKPKTC